MKNSLFSKFGLILILCGLFSVGFYLIDGLVQERQANSQQVIKSIARDNVNEQTMFSPYIVISNAVQPERPIILTTESIDWTGQLNADDTSHKIGIYKAITYANEMTLKGRFSGYGGYNVGSLGQAKMLLQLSDMRGMDGQPALTINGSKRQLFNFASPSQNSFLGMGQAEVTLTPEDIQQGFNFEIRAKVNGLSSIELIPFAKNNTVNLQSKWPSPSYFGSALPNQKYATKGFNASWSNPFLANENATLLKDCLTNQISDACGALNNNARGYGVKLINGIDAYQMLQRTIKYALLFLTITFCAFFLFETLQDLRIHPIQYTLVGAALAIFYLLLLSFSEQIGFTLAYLFSSVACVSLIVMYVSAALKGISRGLILGGLLSAMYATLYVILTSESATLLLGSMFLFVLLSLVMLLTRNVDWYQVGSSASKQ